MFAPDKQQPSRLCGWAGAITTRCAVKTIFQQNELLLISTTHTRFAVVWLMGAFSYLCGNDIYLIKQLYLGNAFEPPMHIFYIFIEACDVRTQETTEGIFF